MSSNIYICAHKQFEHCPTDEKYKVVCGPNDAISTNLELIREDGKISNLGFSELSRLYYIWKNLEIPDYIGICHYRRYFDFNRNGDITGNVDIEKYFNDGYSAIFPKPLSVRSIESNYARCHNIEDLKIAEDVVGELYPEMSDLFSKILNMKLLFIGNSFVMKKEDFLKYCEFIFSVLFEVAKKTNIDITDDNSFLERVEKNKDKYLKTSELGSKVSYQARIFGFLAERLGTLFIFHHFNEKKIAILPFIEISDGYMENKW